MVEKSRLKDVAVTPDPEAAVDAAVEPAADGLDGDAAGVLELPQAATSMAVLASTEVKASFLMIRKGILLTIDGSRRPMTRHPVQQGRVG